MKLKSLLLGVSLAAVSAFAATAETWKLAVTDVEGMERLQLEWGPFKQALEVATGDTFEFYAVICAAILGNQSLGCEAVDDFGMITLLGSFAGGGEMTL